MKIIDNFLSESDFDLVQKFFLSNELPWFWSNGISGKEQGLDYFQLVHKFFDTKNPFQNCNSVKYSNFLQPILNKISPDHILRIKANLRPRTSSHIISDWHTDMKLNQKTAVFYINTNNGYTVFKDDDMRVYSLANRLCLFDGHTEHAGASCTNERRRIVLNINYIPCELDPLR
tara:strand:- start:413 stop:934 length:522 start_codon:yes stop_codon:yes gene_type:complete